jgi:predicted RNase H-like HicB family nuclease
MKISRVFGGKMAEVLKKSNDISFTTNILITKEDGLFVAHCLELDIVAVGETFDEVQREVVSLICAQIDYAFTNDNLDNLFHPAPSEAWQEFYKCKEQVERKYQIRPVNKNRANTGKIIPPWLITKTCEPIHTPLYA